MKLSFTIVSTLLAFVSAESNRLEAAPAQACGNLVNARPFYRAFNSTADEHFYTLNLDELSGFTNKFVSSYIFPNSEPGTVPFYRLYSPSAGDHFYTTSAAESDSAQGLGYNLEGIAGYIYTSGCGGVPFFRLYSAGATDHFYTTSYDEREALLGIGYTSEGVAGYVYLADMWAYPA